MRKRSRVLGCMRNALGTDVEHAECVDLLGVVLNTSRHQFPALLRGIFLALLDDLRRCPLQFGDHVSRLAGLRNRALGMLDSLLVVLAAEDVCGTHEFVATAVASEVDHQHVRLPACSDRGTSHVCIVNAVNDVRKDTGATANHLREQGAALGWTCNGHDLNTRAVKPLNRDAAVAKHLNLVVGIRLKDAPALVLERAAMHHRRGHAMPVEDFRHAFRMRNAGCEDKRLAAIGNLDCRGDDAMHHLLLLHDGRQFALIEIARNGLHVAEVHALDDDLLRLDGHKPAIAHGG